MTSQGNLFSATRQDQILERFAEYHRENAAVYVLWCRFTFEAIRRGRTNLGAGMIAERIRWETGVITRGDEVKLNNDFRAYYARMFMLANPMHEGFFRTRRCRSADVSAFDTDISVHHFGPAGDEEGLRRFLQGLIDENPFGQ